MMELLIALCVIAFVVSLVFGVTWLLTSDSAALRWARIKGGRLIYIRPAKGNRFADSFYTVATVDPFGDLVAFKNPRSKSGRITLNDDGTGDLYGPIEWIDA